MKTALVSGLILSSLMLQFQKDYLYSKTKDYIGKKIKKIIFKGNQNISGADMFALIEMRPGMKLTYRLVNDDLKALFREPAFSYAKVEAQNTEGGVEIIFFVKERHMVGKVEFFGMGELNEQETKEELPLREEAIFEESSLIQSVNLLVYKYKEKGFLGVSVKVRKKIRANESKTIDIMFLIDEGEEPKISKITIEGLSSINIEDLRDSLELEEDGFIADGTFKEELFEKDKEHILNYCRSQGFLYARLIEAKWELAWKNSKKNERSIVIKYKVSEGDQYYFNGYDVTWDKKGLNPKTKKSLFSLGFIDSYFEYRPSSIGKPFDNERFKRDRGIISFLYSQRGYIFARVIPKQTVIELTKEDLAKKEKLKMQVAGRKEGKDYYNLDFLKKLLTSEPKLKGKKFVHHQFIIFEGDQGYIENIIIKGNKKTLEKVIRRELIVKPGMLFNSAWVQRSRERIFNLGFFKEVNVDARPGSKQGWLNLIISVEEQPTGTISLGGGYGTQSGFSIFTELSENNLNGTGQRIASKVEFGPLRTVLNGSWTEPWLNDEPWSLTLSGFFQSFERQLGSSLSITNQQEIAKYDVFSFGGSIGLGHRLGVNWRHYHQFTPSVSRRDNPSSLVDDEIYLLVAQGWQFKNSFINGIYYDIRDNIFNTTSGFRAEVAVEFVGNFLGGQEHYVRYSPSLQYYWWPMDFTFFGTLRKNALRRWRIVFEHRLSVNYTQQTGPAYGNQNVSDNLYVEQENRLTLGGYESLRGWDLYDVNFPLAWRDGGSHRVLWGSELRIPLEPSLLWLVAFFEAGALYDDINQYSIDESTSTEFKDAVNAATLTKQNLSLEYFRYSWGFGIRLQIPILPLRIYMAQRLVWDNSKNWFNTMPNNDEFVFVFGIGDRRF